MTAKANKKDNRHKPGRYDDDWVYDKQCILAKRNEGDGQKNTPQRKKATNFVVLSIEALFYAHFPLF